MVKLIALLAKKHKYRKVLEKYKNSTLFEERKKKYLNSLNTIGVINT